MKIWVIVGLVVLVGCDDDDDDSLRACIDPGPQCEGLCPLYEERLATVRAQWDDGDIDGYAAHVCGAYRVVTRFADEGQVDNYFDMNGVLVSTALRNGPSGRYGRGCIDHVRWQGREIECTSTCAIEYSRAPETLIGVPPCQDECRLPEPACEGVCPSFEQRRDTVSTQFDLDEIDAWFHSICGEFQVISRFDGAQDRTDNYFDADGTLISTRLAGAVHAAACSDFEAWQGPVLDCAFECTVEESRHPVELMGVGSCRCQVPEPACEGLCPTFTQRANEVESQFNGGQIDGFVTWQCGEYRVVSRYSDRGQSDNYYTDEDTLVATALRGNDPDFGQFCADDVAWQGGPIECEPVCAYESSRNPLTLIGVGFCEAPDLGVPDAGPVDATVVDAEPDAGPACAEEGASVPVVPGAPECCAGLAPIGCDRPDAQGMCMEGCVGATICARCGNGACGPGENACNCPEDCAEAACAVEGESVPVIPGAPACCAGLAPIGCDRPDDQGMCPGGCDGATVCARCGNGECGPGENACNCAADCAIPACAAEGESVPVIPNAPECCPGLTPIGCASPEPDGTCPPLCVGAVICTNCGNGACGPGENACNCPQDCGGGGLCRSTADCVDHPAPIRCLGAWRCDPMDQVASDHQGDDGCNYTCLGNLTVCDDERPCPNADRCAPCPFADACDGPQACRAGDDPSCREPADCAGLDHVACEGDWACNANRCEWLCR